MRVARRKRIGVVLFQLGGPDSPEAVEPFLYKLFCDPDIINFPLAWLARKPLARWIAHRRAKIVAEHYAAIGGQSPIGELTERQAQKLEAALAPYVDARVFVAMRYWHPFTAEAARQLRAAAVEEIVLLPLYPQYSLATTGSSLKEWDRIYRPERPPIPQHVVESFYNHPLYIEALVERINASLARFERRGDVHLVFSAHGLPLSLIARGDPYPRQVKATVGLVRERGAWTNAHSLCFQSKVGRQKWLEPSLTATIERLARSGTKQMLVIPVAFVTEHIETLHEINIEARKLAERLGVERFEMMPALDDSARFIETLTDLVLRATGVEATRSVPAS